MHNIWKNGRFYRSFFCSISQNANIKNNKSCENWSTFDKVIPSGVVGYKFSDQQLQILSRDYRYLKYQFASKFPWSQNEKFTVINFIFRARDFPCNVLTRCWWMVSEVHMSSLPVWTQEYAAADAAHIVNYNTRSVTTSTVSITNPQTIQSLYTAQTLYLMLTACHWNPC